MFKAGIYHVRTFQYQDNESSCHLEQKHHCFAADQLTDKQD